MQFSHFSHSQLIWGENATKALQLCNPAWEFELEYTICCIIRLIALDFIRLDYMWSHAVTRLGLQMVYNE